MKHIEMCLPAALVVTLLLTACSGGSTPQTDAPTPIIGDPEPTATAIPAPATVDNEPTSEATPEPVVVDEDDLIAAAIAAFDASPEPVEIIASDVVDASVRDDGTVDLTMCTWTGETVFDQVREVLYRTTTNDTGTIEATLISSAPTIGDCLNTELMNSVLRFLREFDDYYRELLADPASLDKQDVGYQFLAQPDFADAVTAAVARWVEDDVSIRGVEYDGQMPESAVAPLMWRRYRVDESERFGLVACRAMNAEHGLYREDVLLDDFRRDQSSGEQSITHYIVERVPTEEAGWVVIEIDPQVWGDCFGTGDWPEAVNEWKPEPTRWMPWPD